MELDELDRASELDLIFSQKARLSSENRVLMDYIERLAPDILDKVTGYIQQNAPQKNDPSEGAEQGDGEQQGEAMSEKEEQEQQQESGGGGDDGGDDNQGKDLISSPDIFDTIISDIERGIQLKALTVDEKYEIAFAELEAASEELDKSKEEHERVLDELRARIEEEESSIAETKRDIAEFQRDVIVVDESYLTDKPTGERFGHYIEERLKRKMYQEKKLHEKSLTLKKQIKKIEQKLLQREEMGEVLHVIDFEQMKIENQQFLEKIEERNAELLKLKLTTGKIVQVLNDYKKKLGEVTARGDWLNCQMKERVHMIERCKKDLKKVSHGKKLAQAMNQKLKLEERDDDLPYVIDYIRLKAEAKETETKARDLQRKVNVSLGKKRSHTQNSKTRSTSRLGQGL